MNSKILIIGIIGIVVLSAIVFFVPKGGDGTPLSGVNVDAMFALSFQDSEGKSVSLADFKGKPLVVNSWAVWCPFCRKELSDFSAAQRELGDTVVIIAIDRAESLATTKKYTDEIGVTDSLVFWLDSKDTFYQAIGGFSMPETIFIDKDGVIQDHKRGPMEKEEIIQRIQAIL